MLYCCNTVHTALTQAIQGNSHDDDLNGSDISNGSNGSNNDGNDIGVGLTGVATKSTSSAASNNNSNGNDKVYIIAKILFI